MDFRDLLKAVTYQTVFGSPELEVRGLCCHSNDVEFGDVFFCIPGKKTDGHRYAGQAVARGAVALVCHHPLPLPVTQVVVDDSRRAMAQIAQHWYNYPSRAFTLVGVTGTNGKTTITYMLDRILRETGLKTGLLGSVEYRLPNKVLPSTNTTPDSLTVNKLFREMADSGAGVVVMEVSSHALVQERVAGCTFDIAVLSNLKRDHLEYHQEFEAYRAAKASLFRQVGGPAPAAVLNIDDPSWKMMAEQNPQSRCLTYGFGADAEIRASELQLNREESRFRVTGIDKPLTFRLGLPGIFNVYNALAALGVARLMGIPPQLIRDVLAEFPGVPGRCEFIRCGQPFDVVVDYAHNADALRSVLEMPLGAGKGSRKIVVFGCEGGKDTDRRCGMGAVAGSLADYCIITTDNIYDEDPAHIAREIEAGLVEQPRQNYCIILDRGEAIRRALTIARPGDAVIIAGKGHETYQVFPSHRLPFDDRLVAREVLGEIKNFYGAGS